MHSRYLTNSNSCEASHREAVRTIFKSLEWLGHGWIKTQDLLNSKRTLYHFTLLYIHSARENIGVYIQIKLSGIFRFAFANLYKSDDLGTLGHTFFVLFLTYFFCAVFVTLFSWRSLSKTTKLNLLVSLHEEVVSISILFIISLSHTRTLNANLWAFSSLLRHFFQLSVKKSDRVIKDLNS